jgi:hypothetical protein
MGAKEEIHILRGLAQRINNMIFGYRPRGKDVNKRAKRTVSKR